MEVMNAALIMTDQMGLKVNWKKLKVMRVARKGEECQGMIDE